MPKFEVALIHCNQSEVSSSLSKLYNSLISERQKFSFSYYYLAVVPLIVFFLYRPSLLFGLINNGLWISSFDYKSAVFPVTYGTAIFVFVIVFLLSYSRLGIILSIFFGVTLDLGAIGVFESYFDIFQPNSIPYFHLGMSLFALAGITSFKMWKIDRWTMYMIVAFIMAFNFWYIHGNSIPTSYQNTIPFLFNVITKVLAFAIFVIPYYRGICSSNNRLQACG